MNVAFQARVHQLRAEGITHLLRLSLWFLFFSVNGIVQAQTVAPSAGLVEQDKTHDSLTFSAAPATSLLWQALMERAAAAYYKQSPDAAIALYQKALRVAVQTGDSAAAGRTQYYLGRTYSGTGEINEAIIAYQASQTAFEAEGYERDGVYLLSDLGSLYLNIEQYDKARQCAEAALARAKRVQASNSPKGLWPDDYGVAGAYTVLAVLARRAGHYEIALAHLQQASERYTQLARSGFSLHYQLADTLKEIGQTYSELGEHATALIWLRQALAHATTLPDPNLTASILNSIGVLYLEQEDYEQAETYFQNALRHYQKSGNTTDALSVLLNLGVTAQRRGNHPFALDYLQRALTQATSAGKQDVRIAAGEGLGVIYREQHNYAAAREVLGQSLTLARSTQDKKREAELLWRMAEVHQAQAQFTAALTLALQARALALQQRLPKLAYLTAVTIGQLYLSLKRLPETLEILRIASNELENLRQHVAGQEPERQLFFENKVAAYHLLLEIFQQQGNYLEALAAAEGAKARVLLDALQQGQGAPDQPLSLACNPLPFSLADLRRVVGQKTAVLVYTVTPTQTYLFVLKPTETVPAIHLFTIPIKAQELRQRAHSFHQLIAQQRPAFAAEARVLRRLLLEPAAAVLQGVDELCIIPDESLWEVPFQALQAGNGRYVLEDYTVRYAPSLRVLTAPNARSAAQPTSSLLAFGNPLPGQLGQSFPPLPEAEREVAALGKLFRAAQIFTRTEATENRFKRLAGNYDILHLATHAVLNNRQPLESYLLLANEEHGAMEDGRLTAREIMQAQLKARLVVLSACETAQGNIAAGEGVVGLSWAFFLAGCQTLVVSQWQVHSASTADLMGRFFAQRQRSLPTGQSLRVAALELMQQPRYQHPYYWASFIAIGAP